MKIELEAIFAPDRFDEDLERILVAWWRDELFNPILEAFDEADRLNAFDPNEPRDSYGKWTKTGVSKAPPIVYHGTKEDFETFKTPAMFSIKKDYSAQLGSRVIPAELHLNNPADLRALNVSPSDPNFNEIAKKLMKQGYDGAQYREEAWIAFHPEQIRRLDRADPRQVKVGIGGKYEEFVVGEPPSSDRLNAVDDWEPFPRELGSLGIPRINMPQVAGDDRDALVSFLAAHGIGSLRVIDVPTRYKPTQAMYSPAKVEKARRHVGVERPLLVSSDFRILDGHHQWYKDLLDEPRTPVEVVVFDARIRKLMRAASRFPGTTREHSEGDVGDLSAALRSGRIAYNDGVFSGQFSAALSRALRSMGAVFNKNRKTYSIEPKSLPMGIRGVIGDVKARAERVTKAIKDTTVSIGNELVVAQSLGAKLERFTRTLLSNLETQFRASLAEARSEDTSFEFVATPPDFTPSMVNDVRTKLTENLSLSIKTFTDAEVVKIRELAEANWMAGGRVDLLRDAILARFDVTKRKARFLARQETSMVASEFARARAQEIGSTEYVWHTRHDDRVRHDHQELNGKTFQWDDPPLVDAARDRHANPGMDFGCRCVARPILNLSARRVA